MFLKANTTLSATVIFFSLSFHYVFWSPSYGRSFTLYSFHLDHLDRTLVNHLNLHSSICPIRYLLWLSVNGGGWDYTVQGSSLHKCDQKSCCNAFNAMVETFLLDISVFLSSSYMPEVHPYRWKFLEGHLSCPSTCLTDIHPIRERQPPRIVFLHHFLTWSSILRPLQSFTPPQMYPHHQIGPKVQYTNLGPCPHNFHL